MYRIWINLGSAPGGILRASKANRVTKLLNVSCYQVNYSLNSRRSLKGFTRVQFYSSQSQDNQNDKEREGTRENRHSQSSKVHRDNDTVVNSRPRTDTSSDKLSSTLWQAKGKDEHTKDQTNQSKLSAEDEKQLMEMFELVKQGLPNSVKKEFDAVMQNIRKNGIPPDVREIMKVFQDGKPITLAVAARAMRLLTRLTRQVAENSFRKPDETDTNKSEPPNSDASPSPSSSSRPKSKQKNDFSRDFWNGGSTEFRLDIGNLIFSAIGIWLLWKAIVPSSHMTEITWQEFKTAYLDKGLVEKIIVVNQNRAKVYLQKDAVASVYPNSPAGQSGTNYYFTIGSIDAFERHLDDAQNELEIPSAERIPVAYKTEIPLFDTLLSFGPSLLFIGSILWLSRRASAGAAGPGGIFGMGRSRAKKFNLESDVKVKFSDVAGMEEAKQEIMEFVSFLKEPAVYKKLGARIPRGAILSGPPGTGKTLLAKATAGESGVPFFSVSGSEFIEMFVGVGPSRVRDLFATARKHTPCIIFIDEIDAIGRSRSKQTFGGGGNDERESTLNQILTEMDGFNTTDHVVVIAGTNRPDILDKALLRPGRFDRHITLDKPTMKGRAEIFGVHLKKVVTSENLNDLQGKLAALTPGFSGADIANCVNEAALIAARNHASSVDMKFFEQAIERIIGGLEKKSLVLSPDERRVVAYHEAGHAVCGWYFKYADPLLKVSIIPRGQAALGYAQYLPPGDSYLMNVNQLMDRMAMTLGGRVSEELHFPTVTSGASDDFNKVTRLAYMMVTKFGMSRKIGHLYFDQDTQNQLQKPFSEETAKSIDAEVRRIVDEAYKQCRDLLTEKQREIGLIAEELLRTEVLTRADMIRLLGQRPFPEREEVQKYFPVSPQADSTTTDKQQPASGEIESTGPATASASRVLPSALSY